MFSTANRSVKTGLIATGIVSSWTWPITILTSSTFSYSFGISGSFWYGCSASAQLLLFSVLAVAIKMKAPRAHTIVELVYVRFGRAGHLVYMFFALATNVIATAMMLLGASQCITALTGMNIVAANFLLPVSVFRIHKNGRSQSYIPV